MPGGRHRRRRRWKGGAADAPAPDPRDCVEIFEEIKFDPSVMVERIGPDQTLAEAQLENGDIIVFQRRVSFFFFESFFLPFFFRGSKRLTFFSP